MKVARCPGRGVIGVRTIKPNGLTVWTTERKSKLVEARIVFPVGGLDDGEFPGLHHLLEHMLMEGPARESVHPKLRHLARRGIWANAAISHAYSEYYIRGLAEDFPAMFAALLSVCFEPIFTEVSLEVEKRVVLRELEERRRANFFIEWLWRQAYPNTPALGHPLGGTPEAIRRMTCRVLRKAHEHSYSPSNALVSVAGGVSHDEVLSAVSKFPLARKPGKKLPPRVLPEPVFRRATVKSSYVSDGVGLYFPCPADRLLKWRLSFVWDILASAPFGILRERLRVRDGIVYGVSSSFFGWPMALAGISAKADPGKFSYLEDVFFEGIGQIKNLDYPDELFQNQLAERKINIAADKESFSRHGWIDSVRDRWLAGLSEDPPSVRTLLSSTQEDLAAVAAKYLRRDKYGCLAAVHVKS